MLETFREFPDWVTQLFALAEEDRIGLWQLRDLDPLPTWREGRVILIGDAAHAMLPTQGQGASQSVEDAEALGAFFARVEGKPTEEEVRRGLEDVVKCRYERATLVQGYSRQAARWATTEQGRVTMRPDEFMDYNCGYKGALEWQKRQEGAGSCLIHCQNAA